MYLIDKNLMPTPVDVKPDPRSIEGLIAWLTKRDAKEEYDWNSTCRCALGLYRKHCGAEGFIDLFGWD